MPHSWPMTGFTLIEMLIATALGAMIFSLVLYLYMIIYHNFMNQQGIARISENVRAVDIILGKAVRTSGNIGCQSFGEKLPLRIHSTVSDNFNLNHKNGILLTTKDSIVKNPLLHTKHHAKMQNNSDVLWINGVKNQQRLKEATQGEKGYFLLAGKDNFKKNKIAIVSDCAQADAFKIVDIQESANKPYITKIVLSKHENYQMLSKRYHKNALVGSLNSELYYIAKTSRCNSTAQPIYALYRTDLNGVTTELVEGLEFIKILYGVNQSNKRSYFDAKQLGKMPPTVLSNIVSIKITALFNSIENATSKPQSYWLDGIKITPKDRLLRKWIEFEWTVQNYH